MPLTPLHLGPALAFGLPLRKWLHLPTLLLASIAIDVEPLIVLVLKLNYPLHGYLHTFLFAIPYGVAVSYVMMCIERFLNPLYTALLLEERSRPLTKESFLLAGSIGVLSHVLLDSPLYEDIRPFYPLDINPLHNPSLALLIYSFCLWTLLVGFLLCLSLWLKAIVRRC